jgi:hypothetical protein
MSVFVPGNDLGKGRPQGSRNKGSYELRERLKARGDIDPAEFLSSLASDKSKSDELRMAASANLMPYLYSKLGAITPPTFTGTKIAVPEFLDISDVAKFIRHIIRHIGRGSLSFEHGKEYVDLARQWVHTRYSNDELNIKLREKGGVDQVLKIIVEGGLPALPGTNVTMPTQFNGHDANALMEAAIDDATKPPILPATSHPPDPEKP